MLLIVSNKWSKHIRDWWKDPSGLGVVSSVTIQAMSQDITIFGRYALLGVCRIIMEPTLGTIFTPDWQLG